MQEIFEKIIEKLEDKQYENRHTLHNDELNVGIDQAIEIVKQEAERHNNGWIPVSERLPEVNKMVLLYAPYMEYEPISIGCLWKGTDENRVLYFKWFKYCITI